MSAPKITTTAADAPFQTAWKIDAADLHFSERKALMDGLRLEIAGMIQQPWAGFAEDYSHLTVMDATDTVVGQLTALCKRWENRYSIKVEACKLPRIPLRARIMAWLDPTHEAPRSLHRLGNVHKKGSRYYFECVMHSTQLRPYWQQPRDLSGYVVAGICELIGRPRLIFACRNSLGRFSKGKRSFLLAKYWLSRNRLSND